MKKILRRMLQVIYLIKYVISLIVAPFFRKKYNDVWLIAERGDEARDNGFYFYEYLKKNHTNLNIKYIIKKDSYDLKKINKKDVVYKSSFKHFVTFINAKYLISTHHMGYSPDSGMFWKLDDRNLIYCRGKRIFIQHGIIYNYLPSLVNKKIDLFVTSSPMEYKFILDNFGYNEDIVKLTGLCRFDDLNSESERFILLMPTWRQYLFYSSDNEFKESSYCKNWLSFINSKDLEKILLKYNVKILFYPHYEIQKRIKLMSINNKMVKICKSSDYDIHTLLKKCSMLITDYSSTFFDVAYQKKPVLFFHFDYDTFYSKHYEKGYLDLKKGDFGVSCKSLNILIKNVEKILMNNFKNEDKYVKFADKFYRFNDQNNCLRLYNEILKK